MERRRSDSQSRPTIIIDATKRPSDSYFIVKKSSQGTTNRPTQNRSPTPNQPRRSSATIQSKTKVDSGPTSRSNSLKPSVGKNWTTRPSMEVLNQYPSTHSLWNPREMREKGSFSYLNERSKRPSVWDRPDTNIELDDKDPNKTPRVSVVKKIQEEDDTLSKSDHSITAGNQDNRRGNFSITDSAQPTQHRPTRRRSSRRRSKSLKRKKSGVGVGKKFPDQREYVVQSFLYRQNSQDPLRYVEQLSGYRCSRSNLTPLQS